MTAAATALARIEGAGAAAALDPDGRVRIARASRVPAERSTREAGAGAASTAAALLRAAAEEGVEALAAPDPDLARERAEVAAGLRAEAPDAGAAALGGAASLGGVAAAGSRGTGGGSYGARTAATADRCATRHAPLRSG